MFDFVMTVPSVVDVEGEVMPEKEMEEALDKWLIHGSPLTMEHSNKIVGKALRWWRDTYKGNDAYIARGIINDGKVGDIAWENVKSGKYKDVSIGGAAFNPTMMKDGSTELQDLEILEVSLCEEGAHPDADIIDYNKVAKEVKFFAKGIIKKTGRGEDGVPRGNPKTEEEREATHGSKPPARGTGLKAYAEDGTKKDLSNIKTGGNLMTNKEDETPAKKPKEEPKETEKAEDEEEKKPEAKKPEETEKSSFSKADLEAMFSKLELRIAKIEETNGGKVSDETVDEDSPEGDAAPAAPDSGIGAGEDKPLDTIPADSKAVQKLQKEMTEIKKQFTVVEKIGTPRMAQAGAAEEGLDAYAIATNKSKLDFADIRKSERARIDKTLQEVLR